MGTEVWSARRREPGEPIRGDREQDQSGAGAGGCPGFSHGAALAADECRDLETLLGDRCPDPLGCGHSSGFAGQSWLTFRQVLSLCDDVRKGERGVTVVYADRFVPADEKRRARRIGEEAYAIPFLKRFALFQCDQVDGLPSPRFRARIW